MGTMAQRNYIYGVVLDSVSCEEMIGAHIRNINAGLLTSSDPYGKFKIPAMAGDSIVVSSVGHKTLVWVTKEAWMNQEEVKFHLPVNTIYLDEVVVGEFPEYIRFKDQIVNMQVVDSSFEVYGVPKVVVAPPGQGSGLAISGPISALHNAFSKKEKEKRKLNKILSQKNQVEKAGLKFTREWVASSTKLEGDMLTSFIDYCNFSVDYLANTPLYIIHEKMMALLPDFLETYNDQS
ncbi:MAG: hypothetical protein Tsb0034_22560 [Ekhidna sp.]